jgi:site-specific DNA-methyltransferase (adenine-specific)
MNRHQHFGEAVGEVKSSDWRTPAAIFDKLKLTFSVDPCAAVLIELARALRRSGYCMLWEDTFRLVEAHHQRVAAHLKAVDLIALDSLRPGMGKRSRRRGDYLLVLQKPPIRARATWRDHGIPSRWPEKVDRRIHPHIKPIGLIERLIAAVTKPGDLVVDPAAGSFIVMHAARALGRDFVGCELVLPAVKTPTAQFDLFRDAA